MWIKNRERTKGQLLLKNLIDIKEWQKIQDNFSVVTDISIRTIDTEGRLITLQSQEPRLCSEVLKRSQRKNIICGSCLPAFLSGEAQVDKNLRFICRAGVSNFIVPLKVSEVKLLGYIILGPVILVLRKEKEEYRKIAEELSVDLEDFWSAVLELKVVSMHGVRSLVELIKDLGEYTINLAYKNTIKEKEVVMALDPSRLSRILDVLLDVAFEVSQADIGSVMFFDEAQEYLTIRSSRGIPDDIARRTNVRLGEGISGIAAKEGKSFLLDDNIKDNRIRPYLNRPQISSSMVLPIKVENRILGVMNLGALKTSAVRFNVDNLGLINKLIGLATLTISPGK